MVPDRPKFYAAVAVQFAVLVAMILQSFSILASGREVRLKVVPVDPRSLISGDYVILSYDLSTVTASVDAPGKYRVGDAVYVRLTDVVGGLSEGGEVADRPFASGLFLRGTVRQAWEHSDSAQRLRVEYGIESWYVPEGTGREVERKAREGRLVAVLAVTGDGRSALKAIEEREP